MDIQADIKWIKSELTKVKDPELIQLFKNLLNYRIKQENKSEDIFKQLKVTRALKSEDDIISGRVLSKEEMNLRSNSVK